MHLEANLQLSINNLYLEGKIPPSAQKIANHIISVSHENEVFIRTKEIAHTLKMSVATVQRGIRSLVEVGLVEVQRCAQYFRKLRFFSPKPATSKQIHIIKELCTQASFEFPAFENWDTRRAGSFISVLKSSLELGFDLQENLSKLPLSDLKKQAEELKKLAAHLDDNTPSMTHSVTPTSESQNPKQKRSVNKPRDVFEISQENHQEVAAKKVEEVVDTRTQEEKMADFRKQWEEYQKANPVEQPQQKPIEEKEELSSEDASLCREMKLRLEGMREHKFFEPKRAALYVQRTLNGQPEPAHKREIVTQLFLERAGMKEDEIEFFVSQCCEKQGDLLLTKTI